MFTETIFTPADPLVKRACFVHYPLFLKKMKASDWPAASQNFLWTIDLLASGKVRLSDLYGIDIRRAGTGLLAPPQTLRTRYQLKHAPMNPTADVEKRILAAFREKKIDVESILDDLFVAIKEGKRDRSIRTIAAHIADIIKTQVYTPHSNNIVNLFPNRHGPTPQ
jgi:hypothetical protein